MSITSSLDEYMNTQIAYPKVLLVGRTNVGKSTLFNRLTQQKLSIVFDREGVTRDYIQEVVNWNDKSFLLIDTGGLTFDRSPDEIGKQVQQQVLDLLNTADLLLFVIDGKNGITQEDIRIANILRKSKKPVFILPNKADNPHALDDNMPEIYSLGFETIIPISGIHGIGIATLLNSVSESISLPYETEALKPTYNVVIIGRPNVGKSSLMNLLIKHERSIVSDVAGTTREPVSEMTYHCNDVIQLTDTAGVRRSRKIDDDLEELMIKSSLQAIRSADLVLVMIDASEGKIADQELKLLFYAYEQKKMIIAVFNKTDLLDEYTTQTLKQSLEEYHFILKKMPQVWISCLTHKNVGKIFDEIQGVWKRCNQVFDNVQLNETIKSELDKIHLYHSEQQLKVNKIKHAQDAQKPTFVLHVNIPRWFGPSELSCIENLLRKNYDLSGCPVEFIVVKKK